MLCLFVKQNQDVPCHPLPSAAPLIRLLPYKLHDLVHNLRTWLVGVGYFCTYLREGWHVNSDVNQKDRANNAYAQFERARVVGVEFTLELVLRSLRISSRSSFDLPGKVCGNCSRRCHEQRFGGDRGIVVGASECTEDKECLRISRCIDGNSARSHDSALDEAGIPTCQITSERGGLNDEASVRCRDRRCFERG
jgi:hypothetical protein